MRKQSRRTHKDKKADIKAAACFYKLPFAMFSRYFSVLPLSAFADGEASFT